MNDKPNEIERPAQHEQRAPQHYLMQFFAYGHLPQHLQQMSAPFAALAKAMNDLLPENAEKTTALRKLLESKDCAVRAVLFKMSEQHP